MTYSEGRSIPAEHEYVTFGLARAMRPGGVLTDGGYQAHREFLDFTVDGTPLLRRLADLDAVSPLAADLGPSLFTSHVRRLLLEDEPPGPGGRYVIYGCPECEGPECGVVTAVIEQDGGDIVWRDFAWQTDENPDLERNGYHGIGPFRFRAGQYRAVLRQLLDGDDRGLAPARRVLLIGRRAAVLARLAAALRTIGIGAEITRDAVGAHEDELRTYGVVAFGRAVDPAERAAVRRAFESAGADAVFVEGLAPIVPLLVAQIEQALDRTPREQRRLAGLAAAPDGITVEVTTPGRVRVVAYRVDRLYRRHARDLFDDHLEAGRHRIAADRRAVRGETFIVARTSGGVLVAPVLAG
ncbi:oxidoreductase [Streptomyces sp. URMC 123]|uniref:oxidoreductase n=1 Tax=Streptomyces sp. URMC 123 TaxID=3423403 RepID=UPI003F1DDAAB